MNEEHDETEDSLPELDPETAEIVDERKDSDEWIEL